MPELTVLKFDTSFLRALSSDRTVAFWKETILKLFANIIEKHL